MPLKPATKYSIAAGFAIAPVALLFLSAKLAPKTTRRTIPTPTPAVVQQVSTDPISDFRGGLSSVQGMSVFVSSVKPGRLKNEVEIVMTPAFQAEHKAARRQLAVSLWEAWARTSGVADVDKARLRLVDKYGKEIGGSRAIAGSVIYVDD